MTTMTLPSKKKLKFPQFDLGRLIETVFQPKQGERVCILTDFEEPSDCIDFAFLEKAGHPVQKIAYQLFYQGFQDSLIEKFHLAGCDFYGYESTGGSNLELPETAIAADGEVRRLDPDLYSHYDIILCIGSYSATAPLTAAAKKFGFRGSTMHGVNETILASGLAVDYHEVSRCTEKLRAGMSQADAVEIDFRIGEKNYSLQLDLEKQEAQKSHGLCCEGGDIVNLPAGEVYFVPTNGSGSFPIKFEEDGTLALMEVREGQVFRVSLIRGNPDLVEKYRAKFEADPAAGVIGELGFGTQQLPYSGSDIQDEKIFGTFHLALGRNDHLQGKVTKECFQNLKNASHDDILFSSTKTPEIQLLEVRMHRHGNVISLIENYQPCSYLNNLLSS